ncbi:septation protein SepH [Agromyces sp. NPDC056379]|uniref:septation protein SepH n=1 Tax=unclassified Agromyces TaxID=2639701 RepID=UPI0035DB161B
MQELKVIGVENGALLAASDDGARFRIEIDEVLQSRIRQAQPEQHVGPKPSPREVQAHIRAGMSAEEVAQVTGASIDYIRRFEGPVLAEREHMVTSALAVPVHVTTESEPSDEQPSFGGVIRERLAQLGAHGERWASWKDEERGWIIKLEFTAETIDHDARWSFEPRKQALQPLNSEAITLSQQGEMKGGLIPRLRAVGPDSEESRFDSGAFTFEEPEHGDFDTAPHLEPLPYARTPQASSPAVARAAIKRADEPKQTLGETADLLEALRRRRGEREAAGSEPERPPAAPAPAPVQEAPESEQPEEKPGTAARSIWGGKGVSSNQGARGGSKKGRASMPSWDEIVFGARTDDDLA